MKVKVQQVKTQWISYLPRSVPIMTFECVHAWKERSSVKEGFLGLGSRWNKVFEGKARTVATTQPAKVGGSLATFGSLGPIRIT